MIGRLCNVAYANIDIQALACYMGYGSNNYERGYCGLRPTPANSKFHKMKNPTSMSRNVG